MYVKKMGPTMAEKYAAPLKSIILACDRLVDIWNANYSKKCECINSPTHPRLKELRSIFILFDEWEKNSATKDEFITSESWEDL